ncbi:MAG: PqqD family protein [Lachnospiraceae bacterium]|nr:PqqD family protein [Lachnospiraceae bacterium]
MKPAENFSLQYLSDIPYLLPCGQAIADRKRGLRLNETGAFLWTALQETTDREALLARLAAHYDAVSEEMSRLEEDLSAFLSQLHAHGLLTEDKFADSPHNLENNHANSLHNLEDRPSDSLHNPENSHADSPHNPENSPVDLPTVSHAVPANSSITGKILRIGGERIRIQAPAELFNDALLAFQEEETAVFGSDFDLRGASASGSGFNLRGASASGSGFKLRGASASGSDFDLKTTAASTLVCDLEVTVSSLSEVSGDSETSASSPSILHKDASAHRVCLLKDPQLCVTEDESTYYFSFPSAQQLPYGEIGKDGSRAAFYYRFAGLGADFPSETLKEELFHSLRLAFLYHAQKKGLFAIHSASILYQGKAWLFSGHSGMGKSTHARLWTQLYETPQLNGDLNLLAVTPEGPMVYGMPWCGTSGIYTDQTYPLGGVILLKQDRQDFCEELSPDKKTLLLSQRLISPAWTEELLSLNLRFTDQLKDRIPVCRLHCTKESSAAETMKNWIDRQPF